MKTRIPPVLITLALISFVLLPNAQAVVPPPDGGYPGGNTAEGDNALLNVNTAIGINNTAMGANALRDTTTGSYNVGIGSGALASNTAGYQNMAIGTEALTNNNANFNVAVGFRVGFMNTTGDHLTGIGAAALRNNTTGDFNTAIGSDALHDNTTGGANTATGAGALYNNTTGTFNTANGGNALSSNTTGVYNTANGYQTLQRNTTGYLNVAIGTGALFSNTTGKYNTAIGADALPYNTRGSNNIGLGNNTGINVTTASNVICIGKFAFGANVSNTTWIDNVSGVITQNATTAPVIVSVDGQLGTVASSERFKKDIATMDKASEVILSLRPVTFHYKTDAEGTPQFGLIAEEVAKVNPALVLPDKEGKPYTVRYDAVNAMLLNEFLKEHRKNEEQQKQINVLMAQLKEQAAQIQKVSTQLEASKPAPQVVKNP